MGGSSGATESGAIDATLRRVVSQAIENDARLFGNARWEQCNRAGRPQALQAEGVGDRNLSKGKAVERKANRRIRDGRGDPAHHVVNRHVIAPSESIPAAWILNYDRKNTDHLIQLGYEDAKRMAEG